MRQPTETICTIHLDYDQLWVFDGGRDARVRVLHGATWLTEEGRVTDAILRAGDERRTAGGRTLVGALVPSRVQLVTCSGDGPLGALRARWRQVLTTWGRAVRRAQMGPLTMGR